jgi:hypothetical protein
VVHAGDSSEAARRLGTAAHKLETGAATWKRPPAASKPAALVGLVGAAVVLAWLPARPGRDNNL